MSRGEAGGVLRSCLSVEEDLQDVRVPQASIRTAAAQVCSALNAQSLQKWSDELLHPRPDLHAEDFIASWIFLVSVLNFSFWSERQEGRYAVQWRSGCDGKGDETKLHTGYWSLLACLHRAREEQGDIIVWPKWYANASDAQLAHLFRSDSPEEIPLLDERMKVMREAGQVLLESYKGTFVNMIQEAQCSATRLVQLLTSQIASFDDRAELNGKQVLLHKRAQICVAETWAAFGGKGLGRFDDIDEITCFADYRVPQMLHQLGALVYSDELITKLENLANMPNKSREEAEIRVGTILSVEALRAEVAKRLVDEQRKPPNAIELDFYIWTLAKSRESAGTLTTLPHHRTRSCYY
ncbi:uncharacterized protein L969DRAFT_94046 [Mixia osmundae IAM 14324]|uniref:Queuosine 5'-phosphate N-glycosylase/hydrolase n=1 Tax=Mixia osmundae (strain CBS 9802 / IAM 14324 / JCM 22182 / KY 12970) TaxID=764103 RepID=G7E8X6_MIXOS|nr:uncharacterized protein L969DRAFT_94046 [Mixia osmundae IAM 14324]KEI40228.1 hypothetical protein L969DRAFT_94046 [Mixia osmundae IAM 14324]GAA99594.1 hypothetical protein E5Q_06295 [Mixia osmundae IAM 14324]